MSRQSIARHHTPGRHAMLIAYITLVLIACLAFALAWSHFDADDERSRMDD